MGTEASSASTNDLHRVWLAALHELFRCSKCRASLVDSVAHSIATDGSIRDVHCQNCNRLWAFLRVPNSLLDVPQLTFDDLEAVCAPEGAVPPGVLRDRRIRFWKAMERLFP